MLLFTCLLWSMGCEQNEDAPISTINEADLEYLSFGELIPVKDYLSLEPTNPHQVTAHAIWTCSQGQTEALLLEFAHVESNEQAGQILTTYLETFGPDLERFKNVPLAIKLEGYRLNEDSSVWYYYLTSPDGVCLPDQPWVSSHRSRTTQKCALTGIFLPEPGENTITPLPDGIVRTLDAN